MIRNEKHRAAHVQDVLETFQRTMQRAPEPDYLAYATGLLLGVRSLLVTLEEWQRWGECAAALLRARFEADAPVSPCPRVVARGRRRTGQAPHGAGAAGEGER